MAMEYTAVLVAAHLPGREPINLGVLVLDEGTDRLHLRFRTDFDGIEPFDEEVIHGVPEMIESMALEMGALRVLQYLEDRASNAIRLGGSSHDPRRQCHRGCRSRVCGARLLATRWGHCFVAGADGRD